MNIYQTTRWDILEDCNLLSTLKRCSNCSFIISWRRQNKCSWKSITVQDIGFIYHLYTRLVISLTYSAITNFHTLKITSVHPNFFPACSIFTSSCLVTVPNNGYSSASGLKSSPNGGCAELSRSESGRYLLMPTWRLYMVFPGLSGKCGNMLRPPPP
jgi:hypothetical protein